MGNTTHNSPLLRPGQAAARLGVKAKTLEAWCRRGVCPVPFTTLPSGHRRFAAADVDAYITRNTADAFGQFTGSAR